MSQSPYLVVCVVGHDPADIADRHGVNAGHLLGRGDVPPVRDERPPEVIARTRRAVR